MTLDGLKGVLENLRDNPSADSWNRLKGYSDSITEYLDFHGRGNAEYDLRPISVRSFKGLCASLKTLLDRKNNGESYTVILAECLSIVENFRNTP